MVQKALRCLSLSEKLGAITSTKVIKFNNVAFIFLLLDER
jgi:hypothetical protein